MRHELTENEKNRIRNLHESYSNHNGSLMLNEEEVMDKQIVALGTKEGPKYCRANEGMTGKVKKMLSNLGKKNPEGMGVVKKFIQAIKNIKEKKGVKGLFKVLKDTKKAIKVAKGQGKQEVNEQMTPLVIAGVSIAPGILIAVGALLVIIIIVAILKKDGRKSCNPGWWDNL